LKNKTGKNVFEPWQSFAPGDGKPFALDGLLWPRCVAYVSFVEKVLVCEKNDPEVRDEITTNVKITYNLISITDHLPKGATQLAARKKYEDACIRGVAYFKHLYPRCQQ